MPASHTALFNQLITVNSIDSTKLTSWLSGQSLPEYGDDGSSVSFYDQVTDLLREANDARFNIVSKLSESGEWVRDARAATPLAERIEDDRSLHDSPYILGNNALLRCLSRLRAIDYALAKQLPDDPSLRNKLKNLFNTLAATMLSTAKGSDSYDAKLKAMQQLETQFNTELVKILHDAGLAQGCKTAADAEALLAHYRNLSSLLVPARTLVTLTYDERARVLHRETQYPVTEKRKTQLEAIERLRSVNPNPDKEEISAHTVRNEAMQTADSMFVDLMKMPDRALPAQTRETHLAGAKNAFIVKNELISVPEGADPDALLAGESSVENTLWLARSATPVYTGPGETKAGIQAHTRENLEQILTKAHRLRRLGAYDPLSIHVTTLNTDSFLKNQSRMVAHVYDATRKHGPSVGREDDVSYMPTNEEGTFRFLDIAPALQSEMRARGESAPRGSAPLQKATRLSSVTQVVLAAAKHDRLSVVQCASGQDRTGTAIEKATQQWLESRYTAMRLPIHGIADARARGGNAAEIASHHLPGSPGMKRDSIANDQLGARRAAFDEVQTREFYRKSADTNKENRVGSVEFLELPPALVAQYRKEFHALSTVVSLVGESGLADAISGTADSPGILKIAEDLQQVITKTEDLETLTRVLQHTRQVFLKTLPSSIEIPPGMAYEKTIDGVETDIKVLKNFTERTDSLWRSLAEAVNRALHCVASIFGQGQRLGKKIEQMRHERSLVEKMKLFKSQVPSPGSESDNEGGSLLPVDGKR